MADGDIQPLVIDTGSGFFKSGFAGDDAPRSVISSVVGNPAVNRPYQRGIVTNWDDMETICRNIFYNELHVATEEHPVVMSEAIGNPRQNRERMTQMLFETFNNPAIYLASQPVLSLYASGLQTGVVIESGDGVTQIVPIHENVTSPNTFSKIDDLAGIDITDYLANTLNCEDQIAKEIKENCCHVALDFDSELDASENQSFHLPDGQQITLGTQRFCAPEALFQPDKILSIDRPGIHQVVHDAIQKFDSHVQAQLYRNIVPAGGSTLFPGFIDRLGKEIFDLAPSANPNIITPKDQQYSAWVGGSILASLSTFQNLWVSKQEYDDEGPSVVHKKCY
ncbi:actin family [Aspergillus caelatus]|uniref:Actin family n=2 Tax=Aspergillus subgen. Circumdati TaxID=2720871 RepID=A0A5N6ZI38_9EURO|nr:actin family [Aspergillus caelatus]KAE8357312.1 actin family [Aspergillus caelatus]KAE8421479.1 actin family [Aspergillus pseudocaelatus]